MLVLAPAACCLAGIAVNEALVALFRGLHSKETVEETTPKEEPKPKKAAKHAKVYSAHPFCSTAWIIFPSYMVYRVQR